MGTNRRATRLLSILLGLCIAASSVFGQQTPKAPARPTAKPAPAKTAKPAGMTNQDVIKMVAVGLPDDVVIAAIREAAESHFDVTPNGLIAVKQAKVSDAVIRTMQEQSGSAVKPAEEASRPPSQPTVEPQSSVDAPASAQSEALLRSGMEMKLRLTKTLSSAKTRVGELVPFAVADDVMVNGAVVIPKDAAAWGKVTQVKSQRLVRAGSLEFTLTSVRAVDDHDLKLTGGQSLNAGRGLVTGNELILEPGALVTAAIDGDQVVTLGASATPAKPTPINTAAKAAAGSTRGISSIAAKDPTQTHEPGIYVIRNGALEQLEPAIVTGGGTGAGQIMLSGLSMGLKKMKQKAEIRGAKANVRVAPEAEFFFYGSDFNPNKFIIVELDPGDSNRAIVIGEQGLLGVRNGVRNQDQIPFKATRVAPNAYTVAPSADLAPGEYALADMSDMKVAKIWDFGVDR